MLSSLRILKPKLFGLSKSHQFIEEQKHNFLSEEVDIH